MHIDEYPRQHSMMGRITAGTLIAAGALSLAACGESSDCGGTVKQNTTASIAVGEDLMVWVYNNSLHDKVVVREGNPFTGEKLGEMRADSPSLEVKGRLFTVTGLGEEKIKISCAAIDE